MAMKRGTSLPAGGMVNPFWSQRTREEWQLRAVRPADLPVPEDEETQRQLEQEVEFPALEEGETSRGRTRRSSRVPSPRRAAGVFRTPQSWETGKGVGSVGLRTSGMMPMEEEEMSVNPDRTTPQGVDDGSDPSGQSLQRALEKWWPSFMRKMWGWNKCCRGCNSQRGLGLLRRQNGQKYQEKRKKQEGVSCLRQRRKRNASCSPQTEQGCLHSHLLWIGVVRWKCQSYHHGLQIYGRTMRKTLVIGNGSRDLVENRIEHQENCKIYHLNILATGWIPDRNLKEVVKFQAAGQVPDRKYVIKKSKVALESHRLIGSDGCFESWRNFSRLWIQRRDLRCVGG